MRKFSTTAVFIVVIAAIGLILYGCSGTVTTPSGSQTQAGSGSLNVGADLNGQSKEIKLPLEVTEKFLAQTDFNNFYYNHMNPFFRDRLEAPHSYKVGMAEMKFLQENNYNSATAYTIPLGKVNGADPSVANPFVIDLSAGSFTIASGIKNPTPGTYTHMGINLVYIEQTLYGCFDTADPTKLEYGSFRVYPSTTGSIQAGDILFYKDGVWNWLNPTTFALTPITSSRPGGTASGWNYTFNQQGQMTAAPAIATGVQVLQDSWWSLRTTNNLPVGLVATVAAFANNGYVTKEANQMNTPFIIQSGKSYTCTATFNVAATPDSFFTGANAIPDGDQGCFFWDDTYEDNVFKPFLSYANGGDLSPNTTLYGSPSFAPMPPTITFSSSQTQ